MIYKFPRQYHSTETLKVKFQFDSNSLMIIVVIAMLLAVGYYYFQSTNIEYYQQPVQTNTGFIPD